MGYKPNSVPPAIKERGGHDHLTGTPVARRLVQPTRRLGRAALERLPIWSCTRWGLPCPACRQAGGELLPRHFTLACGFFEKSHRRCLFCGTFPRLPGVRVTNHRALWCSDFPPRFRESERSCAHPPKIRTCQMQ